MRASMNLIDNPMMEATCDFDSQYRFVHGDERYFRMLGDYVGCDLDKLIYKDDWEGFKEYLDSENYDEPYMVRMLIKQDCYRYVIINRIKEAVINFRNKEVVKYFLIVNDIVQVTHKFSTYYTNLRKYRKFLSQINVNYFDYNIENDAFSIYYYAGGYAKVIYKEPLADWQKRINDNNLVVEEDKDEFNRMCDLMREGREEFNIILHTSMFSESPDEFESMCFKGELFTDGFKLNMTTGIVFQSNGVIVESGNREDADLDMFTGLLNKKVVTETITNEIEEAAQSGRQSEMYLCVIDIDDFKTVNDTYGHKFGDEVILMLANALKETFENNGIIGRIGGDEFVCLLSDFNNVTEFRSCLTDMRKKLKKTIAEKMPGYIFSVSIGIATYPECGRSYEELFKIADASLYIAKEKGKDRFILFNKELHSAYIDAGDRENGRVVADFMKPIEKNNMAADMIIKLVREGKSAVPEVLDDLMDRLNVHGIVLSRVDVDTPDIVLGHYSEPMKKITFTNNEKYMQLFDENGINKVNNVISLSYNFKEIYDVMREYDLCSTLQVKLMRDGNFIGFICFDTFGIHRRKWSQDDISAVYMVCKAIETVI